jgi:ABC-type glycerol-3-phosphate transport system permease component
MPILSPIGRRRASVRWLIASIYTVLILGAATMIYPFLLMLAGSTKSAVDFKSWHVIPAFLRDDAALYRKHIEALFNESLEALYAAYETDTRSFEQLDPPARAAETWITVWRDFLRTRRRPPSWAASCGHIASPVSKTTPANLRAFRRFAAQRVGRTIEEVNRAWGTDFQNWTAVFVQPENYLLRVRMPGSEPFDRAFEEFKRGVGDGDLYFLVPDLYWRQRYLPMLYGPEIAEFNRAHGSAFASYREIRLSQSAPPAGDPLRADWERFVRHTLHILWIRVRPEAADAYRRYLRARYENDIHLLNARHGTHHPDFDAIELPSTPPLRGLPLSDWTAWIEGWRDPQMGAEFCAPLDSLVICSVATEFRDYLAERFGSITSLNNQVGTRFASWENVLPPQQEAHYADFAAGRAAIRREFVLRNYQTVMDYIGVHGRGIWNTLIYTGLSVLAALLVNPAAAYALSRFRRPVNYRVLLFLLLPMAFPPMVTQIPVFLLLRRLHLLNTFAALLLPALANGYSIFLLKGFFDSLPRELYETAQLDGAGEWTMFRHITMALSKPILAVIALQAFTQAYSNFLYALLICQDERMWTLMVWIYQLQERSGIGVIHASLLIAAVPMLIIYLLCQRVILRGLVIPIER